MSFTIEHVEFYLLVLIRITSFVIGAPFFGYQTIPMKIRLSIGMILSLVAFQTVPVVELHYVGVLGFSVLVLKEMMVGLILGFMCNMCTYIISFAGQLMDMEMGLSMASMMDPTTKETSTITGIYYNYMVLLMLMISGMHRYLLKALAETYTLIPINGAIFRADAMLDSLLEFMANYIIIGFRICLPIFAVMIILNAVLGVLAKVSPQLNMFAVGIQMKVLVGISILFLSTAMLPGAADFIYSQMKHMVVSFTEAIMP